MADTNDLGLRWICNLTIQLAVLRELVPEKGNFVHIQDDQGFLIGFFDEEDMESFKDHLSDRFIDAMRSWHKEHSPDG